MDTANVKHVVVTVCALVTMTSLLSTADDGVCHKDDPGTISTCFDPKGMRLTFYVIMRVHRVKHVETTSIN